MAEKQHQHDPTQERAHHKLPRCQRRWCGPLVCNIHDNESKPRIQEYVGDGKIYKVKDDQKRVTVEGALQLIRIRLLRQVGDHEGKR